MNRGAWQATFHGIARVRHDLVTKPPPPHRKKIFLIKKKSINHYVGQTDTSVGFMRPLGWKYF